MSFVIVFEQVEGKRLGDRDSEAIRSRPLNQNSKCDTFLENEHQ